MSILITILMFGIIVVLHEFGHFIIAKKSGVYVEEFAVGMGPKLFGITRNGTLYSVRLLPLGGFCRMKDASEGLEPDCFEGVNVFKRIAIVTAGPIMNFVLALFIFIVITALSGYAEPTIAKVIDGYPAKEAGLMADDKIIELNGDTIRVYNDLVFALSDMKQEGVSVTVERNGEKIEKVIIPKKNEEGRLLLGVEIGAERFSPLIGQQYENTQRAGIIQCMYKGFWETILMIKMTFVGFIQLVTAQVSMNDVSGVIGMTQVVDTTYKEIVDESILDKILVFLRITGLLSANLGVMNLLPLPALDGGRLIFMIIEIFRGKPIPPEKEGMVHLAGFVLLMIFGVVVAFNDISKFF